MKDKLTILTLCIMLVINAIINVPLLSTVVHIGPNEITPLFVAVPFVLDIAFGLAGLIGCLFIFTDPEIK